MRNYIAIFLFFIKASLCVNAQQDSVLQALKEDVSDLKKEDTYIQKAFELSKTAIENRLNAQQLSVDKQLFFLDPSILAAFGLSAVGSLFYMYFSYIPKRIREETARRIALLTDTDRELITVLLKEREEQEKWKKTLHIGVSGKAAGVEKAISLLKDILEFKNVYNVANKPPKIDLLILYDPEGDRSIWETFERQMNTELADCYLYFGPVGFDRKHENLNYVSTKFNLEANIIKTIKLHPKL